MTFIYEGAVSASSIGGARIHFEGIARALARQLPNDLTVLVPRFVGEPKLELALASGDRIIRVPSGRRALLGHLVYEAMRCLVLLALRVRDLIGRRSTFIVFRQSPISLAPVLLRATGAHVVLEVNGLLDAEFDARQFHRSIVKAIGAITSAQIRTASGIVAVTDGLAAHCRALGARHVVRIENGVDLDLIGPPPTDRRKPARSLVYSGAFAPWHELDVLLNALAELVQREAPGTPPWRLKLIGDGEERRRLEALVNQLGLRPRVAITGWVPRQEASTAILSGNIAVAPLRAKKGSTTCGSPLKVFEYLAVGLPVVASDVDGISELEGLTIKTYVAGDPRSLASAIEWAEEASSLNTSELAAMRDAISWDDRARRLVAFVYGLAT